MSVSKCMRHACVQHCFSQWQITPDPYSFLFCSVGFKQSWLYLPLRLLLASGNLLFVFMDRLLMISHAFDFPLKRNDSRFTVHIFTLTPVGHQHTSCEKVGASDVLPQRRTIWRICIYFIFSHTSFLGASGQEWRWWWWHTRQRWLRVASSGYAQFHALECILVYGKWWGKGEEGGELKEGACLYKRGERKGAGKQLNEPRGWEGLDTAASLWEEWVEKERERAKENTSPNTTAQVRLGPLFFCPCVAVFMCLYLCESKTM